MCGRVGTAPRDLPRSLARLHGRFSHCDRSLLFKIPTRFISSFNLTILAQFNSKVPIPPFEPSKLYVCGHTFKERSYSFL